MAERTAPTTPPNRPQLPPQLQQEFQHRVAWKAGVMGAMNVAVAILGVRLGLLVAISGAIGLAYISLNQPDPYRLATVAIFALAVVLPMIMLASRR